MIRRIPPRSWLIGLLAGLGGLALLRACVPQLWGPYLPAAVVRKIVDSHTECIGIQDAPIWPGEPRQAQCSNVSVVPIAFGDIPSSAPPGTTRAICYQTTIEHPFWETLGQTRHEILTATRESLKVAILQSGEWRISPDDDISDRAMWELYGCPTVQSP